MQKKRILAAFKCRKKTLCIEQTKRNIYPMEHVNAVPARPEGDAWRAEQLATRAIANARVHVGVSFEEQPRALGLPTHARSRQRRASEAVLRVDRHDELE